MSVISSQYKSNTPTAWRWPLQIGIMPDAPELIEILHRGYWSAQFTELKVLEQQDGKQESDRVNILLFTKGLRNAIAHRIRTRWKADIIIIIDEPGVFAYEHFIEDILYFTKETKPSGLFVVSSELDLSTWWENMIVELSHDKNILEAIRPQISDGHLYYDPRIEAGTRLSNVVKGLIIGLNTGFQRPGTIFNIDSRLTGQQSFSPLGLAQYLIDKLPDLRYDMESHTATDILDLTKVLYDKYSMDDFHHHVEKSVEDYLSETRGLAVYDTETRGLAGYVISDNPGLSGYDISESAGDSYVALTEAAAPRFLQTQVLHPSTRSLQENYLLPETTYLLQVRIGLEEGGWLHDITPIDTGAIFKDSTANEEPIDLVFRQLDETGIPFRQGIPSRPGTPPGPDDSGQSEQKTTILLPRLGNSTLAGFTCQTGTQEYFMAGIEAYHHNKLLQKLRLRLRIRTADQDAGKDGVLTKLVFCTRTDFSNLSEETKYDASFTYNEVSDQKGSPAGSSLSGMTGGKPLSLYFSDPLADLMNEIKGIIQKTILDIDSHPEDLFDSANVDVLRKLALKGNRLFVQHLHKHDLRGPLQIVTNRPGFVPLDFVYQPAPPALNATLCPGAKTALEQGACASCYDKTTSPAPHICPFGFWGFSQVIERSAMERDDAEPGDYLITAQPTSGRRTLEILNNTLHASSSKVDGAVTTIRRQVSDTIIKYSVTAVESSDWASWKKITQEQNPDSMILLVHVEKELQNNEYQIEIGDQQFLLQNYFDTTMIKPVPEKRSPFMIVIGCETSRLDSQGFDISSKLIQEGAAIVLSNFTKISGRRAGPIVMKLIEYLKEQKGDQLLGQVMLRLRQYLLSQGMLSGLSLVAYGDADWKLKS